MPTAVLACTCKHKYQDKVYGQGLRLHNITDTKGRQTRNASQPFCCTVCSKRKGKNNEKEESKD